ncbi:hypothetical protein KSS87_003000 [Heliosperma pusillum]|nr:hypothetical protein KSS87_003000 [Heliosperma pusillum]
MHWIRCKAKLTRRLENIFFTWRTRKKQERMSKKIVEKTKEI